MTSASSQPTASTPAPASGPRRGNTGPRITAGPGGLAGRFAAMASPCEILIDAPDRPDLRQLLRQAAQETWRIERKFSRYRADSAVSRINASAGHCIEVDAETARLLDFATQAWCLSDGRFDITSGVLRSVWHFDGSDKLPSEAAVSAVVSRIGWHRVRWQRPWLTLPAGMEIDLGGIGKEYAVDRVLERLSQHCDAPILVNFGGDLRCNGPRRDGAPWRVGIDTGGAGPAQELKLYAGALATSGDANRYLQRAGRRYGHVLNPHTGWPVDGAPSSVTVAADNCTTAGLLATFALLQGDQAETFLQAEADRYWCRPARAGAPINPPDCARAESCTD